MRTANYNKELDRLAKAVTVAKDALLARMMSEYPRGAVVTVVHERGAFSAVVLGWDILGYRVTVENVDTNKRSKWWYVNVQTVTP